MARLRFQDILDSRIPAKLALCPTDEGNIQTMMQWCSAFEARAAAYGRWWGSTQLAQFCITGSCGGACIVLPRGVAVIEAANLNGMPVNVQNMWGQFVRPHLTPGCGAGGCSNVASAAVPCNGFQPFSCRCGCGCNAVPQMQDEGMVPSYAVTGAGDRIRLYATNAADNGKKVVLQGYDSNGVWVRTSIDGTVQDGVQVTLSVSGVTTTQTWAAGSPTALYKQLTSYNVLMFALDADDNERALGVYQPTELNPSYRKVRLPGVKAGCGTACGGPNTLRCLVSLEPTPITSVNDFLLYTNLPAYSDGMYAEKLYESSEVSQGDAYFFGLPKPARNNRGVLRVSVGSGALPLLESELRKMTGDRTTVSVQRDGLSLIGFV